MRYRAVSWRTPTSRLRSILIVWLRGFWTEADEPMILDLERLEADAARVAEFCANNPGMKVFRAADKIFQ